MSIEKKLNELGITLPEAPAPGGLYSPFVRTGNLVFGSGFVPAATENPLRGKLGSDLTIEQGQEAARLCILNCLAAYKATFGTLDNIKRAVKMVAFIQSAPDFYSQAQVANGGSQLLLDVIDAPAPDRSAIGMAALPLNVPVEIEVVFEVE